PYTENLRPAAAAGTQPGPGQACPRAEGQPSRRSRVARARARPAIRGRWGVSSRSRQSCPNAQLEGHAMKVGFIGLGHMGSGMAASLRRAGHEVTVYNRSADKRRPLREMGAREAATVADACAAEVVITMLAGDEALRQVALADQGIIAELRQGGTHV